MFIVTKTLKRGRKVVLANDSSKHSIGLYFDEVGSVDTLKLPKDAAEQYAMRMGGVVEPA